MTMSRERSPLLVTGAHRTGTTWVGRMLTASGEAAYISEPLNVHHRPGVCRAPVRHWYTYLCAETEAEYLPALRETLAFRYHLLLELRALRTPRDLARMGRDALTFLRGRLFGLRPLLKDPFAVFSIPWFVERLGCRVVVTVRHPAAFASSLKRLNWPFDMRDLLAQPALMRDHLEPFRCEMETTDPNDVIGQSALLWRMIYRAVDTFRRNAPDLRVVRHEDLAREPLAGFRALYEHLGLTFNARARRVIEAATRATNPAEAPPESAYAVRLNSRAVVEAWRRRLSAGEITRLRRLTEDVASLYYSESDWP